MQPEIIVGACVGRPLCVQLCRDGGDGAGRVLRAATGGWVAARAVIRPAQQIREACQTVHNANGGEFSGGFVSG